MSTIKGRRRPGAHAPETGVADWTASPRRGEVLGMKQGIVRMETEEIAAALRSYIRERFGIPSTDTGFDDSVDLFNVGYIDSLGAVELSNFIAERFAINLDGGDWVSFPLSNISEMSSFISRRQKGEV
jgi:acyl carrier protein